MIERVLDWRIPPSIYNLLLRASQVLCVATVAGSVWVGAWAAMTLQ